MDKEIECIVCKKMVMSRYKDMCRPCKRRGGLPPLEAGMIRSRCTVCNALFVGSSSAARCPDCPEEEKIILLSKKEVDTLLALENELNRVQSGFCPICGDLLDLVEKRLPAHRFKEVGKLPYECLPCPGAGRLSIRG